ncbi:hypothetical protein FQN53_001987 [Emmonsiellopsis sp. PD_33]|nr:hypothetical protein FQN53_001987 [Emmonsiellopsis sp. PD_33]
MDSRDERDFPFKTGGSAVLPPPNIQRRRQSFKDKHSLSTEQSSTQLNTAPTCSPTTPDRSDPQERARSVSAAGENADDEWPLPAQLGVPATRLCSVRANGA